MKQIINFKTRTSRLATRIRSWFKEHRDEDLTFGEILDKYCENGMPRRHVAQLLMDVKGTSDGSRLGDSITIKDTPIWEAWKAEVAQGRCSFYFHGKFPGNQYHGNLGKPKRKKKALRREGEVEVDYACIKCENQSFGSAKISAAPRHLIALKVFRCPKCGKYATTVGKFQLDGETVFKAVVDRKEQFVKGTGKELIPIERKAMNHG